MVGIGPGSPAPRNPQEVEALLRIVPRVAFISEIEALLPAPLPAADAPLDAAAVTAAADPAWLARMIDALHALQRRAQASDDGGLRFLVVTLRHFLTEQRIAPGEHPLVVSLFLRTLARRDQRPDHPSEIARALNAW